MTRDDYVAPALTQVSSRYPITLVDEAHDYARAHRLPIKVVLCAALAEYLAKREDPAADPAPQLHYRRGRPSASLLTYQSALMHVDHRGRKLRPRRRSHEDGRIRVNQRVPLDAADGPSPRLRTPAGWSNALARPRATAVRLHDGKGLPLAA